MNVLDYVIGGVIIVFSLIIIGVVLLQEGRQANLGAISGAAESFMAYPHSSNPCFSIIPILYFSISLKCTRRFQSVQAQP